MERPNIFEYLDYRQFMSHMMDYLKEKKSFSVRQFTRAAGFKSTSYFSMIINQKRNLMNSGAKAVAKGFELDAQETKFFLKLVEFKNSNDLEEIDQLYSDLSQFKKFQTAQPEVLDQYEYFSRWYLSALFVALGTRWRNLSPSEMASQLGVSVKEINEGLEILERMGLIKREANKFVAKSIAIETPPEMKSLNIRNYHRQMMAKGLEALDHVAPERREVSSLTLYLNERQLKEVKKKVLEFQREMRALTCKPEEAREVYQICIQAFPLLSIE